MSTPSVASAMENKKSNPVSRQDRLLQQLRQTALPVAIYLLNGVKLLGTIVQFDAHVIILQGASGISQIVFKHAILTIVPQI